MSISKIRSDQFTILASPNSLDNAKIRQERTTCKMASTEF